MPLETEGILSLKLGNFIPALSGNFQLGLTAEGKRIRRRKTVKANGIKEARKKWAEFKVEVEAGEYISPEKMKFRDFVKEWRTKHALENLEPTTLTNYELQLKNHILPELGYRQINEIEPFHIVNFLNKLKKPGARKDGKEGGLSGTSRRFIHRILIDIFDRAKEWKLIKSNPARAVKRPKDDTEEREVFYEKELLTVFQRLEKEPLKWRTFVEMAATTGMRRGELLALDIRHIRLKDNKGFVDVRESLAWVKGKPYFKEVKSKKSKRTIALTPEIIPNVKALSNEVKKNKIMLGDKWKGGDHMLLFGQWNGLPTYKDTPLNWFKKFLKRHGIKKKVTIHGLRHSMATFLLAKGRSLKEIQERLGHADVRTTANLYTHFIKELDEESANAFSSLKKMSN